MENIVNKEAPVIYLEDEKDNSNLNVLPSTSVQRYEVGAEGPIDKEHYENDEVDSISDDVEPELDNNDTDSADNSDVDTTPDNVVEPKVEKKPRKWKHKRDIFNENQLLAAELEKVRQEKEWIAQQLNQSVQAENYHYGTVALNALDNAKAKLTKALGEADVEAVAAATAEIAQATAMVNEAARLQPQQTNTDVAPQNNKPIQQAPNIQDNTEMLYEWLDENPELDRQSGQYDEKLANSVLPFIKRLDGRLRRNGQEHLISTGQYFNAIDDYIDGLKYEEAQLKIKKATATPKVVKEPVNKHFGGVRSRQTGKPVEIGPVKLTPQQEIAANAFGMTHEAYIKSLRKHIQMEKK